MTQDNLRHVMPVFLEHVMPVFFLNFEWGLVSFIHIYIYIYYNQLVEELSSYL